MQPHRLLVTGGAGLLGSAVVAAARGRLVVDATWHRSEPPPGLAGLATWHALDITDPAAVRAVVAAARPDVVVHAAIDVSPAALEAATVAGAAHVAAAAHAARAGLVHLSSDMVFDGESGPFDESSPPSPITDYGRAKAAAEARVRAAHPDAVIARLPLLYRLDPLDRALAGWIEAAQAGRGYALFVDEFRRPACVPDVAEALVRVAGALAGVGSGPTPGIIHLPGPVRLSRHAFGLAVLAALGLPASLAIAGRSNESPAPRPRDLDFVAPATPADWLAPLRSPAAVFSARRPAMPPEGRSSAR